MANYCCATRTNYFRVKEPEAFKKFMNNVYTDEGDLDVWEEEKDGHTVFGFGGYCQILGMPIYTDTNNNDYPDDFDYDEFINGLADHVADDDAVIVLESGNEKLRYVVGSALVVTSKDSRYLEISALAANAAAEMLDNSNWKTQLSY